MQLTTTATKHVANLSTYMKCKIMSLLVCPEDGGSIFLGNVKIYRQTQAALKCRRPMLASSPL
jgi:hypothetical protein